MRVPALASSGVGCLGTLPGGGGASGGGGLTSEMLARRGDGLAALLWPVALRNLRWGKS